MSGPRVLRFAELLEQYQEERGRVDREPVRLGFGSLDADMRGISPGQVCGIAARTSVGKTWLLETVAHYFTLRPDEGCLALSLEMPGLEWAERQLAIHADVAPEQVEAWAKDRTLEAKAGLFLERTQHYLVVEQATHLRELGPVCEEARGMLAPVPLRMVLIDYLGLLHADGRDAYERASAIARGLKGVAKEQRVALVVAMQLSRAGGDGSVPVKLEMFRDSGVAEESLDFAVGCWRPGKADGLSPPEQMDLKDVMRACLLKNRKGNEGRTVDLRFRPDSRRLYEVADPFEAALAE